MKQLLSDYKFWVLTLVYAATVGGMFTRNAQIYTRLDAIESIVGEKIGKVEYAARQKRLEERFDELKESMENKFNELKTEVKANLGVVSTQYAEIQRFMGFVEANLESLNEGLSFHRKQSESQSGGER
jgi:hypothetical protein